MLIVVGLGNPGKDYETTYHNVGFCVVDKLADKLDVKINKKTCSALVGALNYNGEKIYLVKPQTFMNLSGDAVASVIKKYDATPDEIVVIYDDIDLNMGTIRIKHIGSAGTHNGMKDIIKKINTQEFVRFRVGTGPVPEHFDLADYVLSHFGKNVNMQIGIDKTVDAVYDYILKRDLNNVCQKYNGTTI